MPSPGGIAAAPGAWGKGLSTPVCLAGSGDCDALATGSAPGQCPREGTAAAPVSWDALPSPSLQPGSSLLLTVVYGLPAVALSQSLIPAYPPLTSFQDSAADDRDFRVVLCAVQRRANAGDTGQQYKWRKGFKGLEGRRDQVSDGAGRAGLDLGLSFGFPPAGLNTGPWMWAEGCDQGQLGHISREAPHLAQVVLSKSTLIGSCSSVFCGGCWGMARALLQRKLAAAQARLWRKFLQRVPDGMRSAAKAADGGSQPTWTWWRSLCRLQRALVSLTETPHYGKLKPQCNAVISTHPRQWAPASPQPPSQLPSVL